MIPLKKLREATHFRKTNENKIEMCKPEEEGALEVPLYEIDMNFLVKPQITDVSNQFILSRKM